MSDLTETTAAPEPNQPSASCCAPEVLATCCEPSGTAVCCGEEPTSGECGCE